MHEVEQHVANIKQELETLLQQLELVTKETIGVTIVSEQQRLTRNISELLDLNESVDGLTGVLKLGFEQGSIVKMLILQDWMTKQKLHIRSSIDRICDKNLDQNLNEMMKEEFHPITDSIQRELEKLNDILHIPDSANSEKKGHALSSIPSTNDVEGANGGHEKRSKSVVCEKAEHPAIKPKSISAQAKTPSLFEMDIKQIAEYDISVSDYSDKHCIHNGSVLLKDGKMVFIDRSNQLLKLLSPDFRVLSHRVFERRENCSCNTEMYSRV